MVFKNILKKVPFKSLVTIIELKNIAYLSASLGNLKYDKSGLSERLFEQPNAAQKLDPFAAIFLRLQTPSTRGRGGQLITAGRQHVAHFGIKYLW